MRTVKLGDKVLVHSDEYESVYSFGHYDQDIEAQYLKFVTSAGKVLEISKDHMVFTEGRRCVPASNIMVGDKLEMVSGDLAIVTSISVVMKKGAFAPFTDSGTVVVNGVKASSFIAFQGSSTLKIAGVDTGLEFQFLAHTFERPRRFWCRYLSSCLHEEYTIEGLSQRLASTHSAVRWYFDKSQTSWAMSLLFATPVLLYVVFLAYPIIVLLLCLVLGLPMVMAIISPSILFQMRRENKVGYNVPWYK
jgi:Hint module